jgi:amidophosphoribosyltransferase
MCGTLGIFSHKPVAQELYDGLIHLQHRGQDSCGILTYNEKFHIKRGAGLVRDNFVQDDIDMLQGNMGIAHVRYPTAGSKTSAENAPPLMIFAPYGIAMSHNGDLVNYYELRDELIKKDRSYFNTTSDLEIILNIFALEMHKRFNSDEDIFKNICESVDAIFTRCSGAYSVCSVIAGKGMVVFRDPHGIRPLACGTRINEDGKTDYIFSSENTMFYPLGFKHQGDVQPGEVVFINMKGEMYSKKLRNESFTPDIFEYIYLARPDSMINNVSVYRSRLRMGQNLAKKWLEKYPDIKPDIVIPIPFSSNTAALSFAHEIGVRYSEGIYKNPFVGRTFMMPKQEKRKRSVLQKLSPQEVEIKDKSVLLLDDSIVRGTTSKEVVKMVRESGAKKVYFVTTCPPVKYPDFYGIDIPTRKELIATNKTIEEIREYMDVDVLLYQEIEDLVEAVTRKGEHNIDRPSMPYLDNWYVTGDVDEEKIKKYEELKEHSKRC